jgi:ABC-type uncharacterized transport system permease subunit
VVLRKYLQIAQIPSEELLGKLSWQYLIFALVFSILLLIVAIKFWKFGLKRYSSASS